MYVAKLSGFDVNLSRYMSESKCFLKTIQIKRQYFRKEITDIAAKSHIFAQKNKLNALK